MMVADLARKAARKDVREVKRRTLTRGSRFQPKSASTPINCARLGSQRASPRTAPAASVGFGATDCHATLLHKRQRLPLEALQARVTHIL